MPSKYIRVLTEATKDNPGVAPLIFDVVLDTKTGRVALDDAIFGWQYALNDYSYPFVVKANKCKFRRRNQIELCQVQCARCCPQGGQHHQLGRGRLR
jgi:hypothetical protein